jgi:hypothetical protein
MTLIDNVTRPASILLQRYSAARTENNLADKAVVSSRVGLTSAKRNAARLLLRHRQPPLPLCFAACKSAWIGTQFEENRLDEKGTPHTRILKGKWNNV